MVFSVALAQASTIILPYIAKRKISKRKERQPYCNIRDHFFRLLLMNIR